MVQPAGMRHPTWRPPSPRSTPALPCALPALPPKFAAGRQAGSAAIQVLDFKNGNATVVVKLGPAAALSVTANGNAVALPGSATLPGGIRITTLRFSPPSKLVMARATIDAGG